VAYSVAERSATVLLVVTGCPNDQIAVSLLKETSPNQARKPTNYRFVNETDLKDAMLVPVSLFQDFPNWYILRTTPLYPRQ
jgi:hypothetical protein